jgi:LysR family transcriptional regulator, glycine cleavage system transcriptional activator
MNHSLPDLPPLDALLAVLAAAQSGSLTLAAERLGVTHGAISRRVAVVEAWLGKPVFERHGRGVRVTPAGQRFTQQIQQAMTALEQTSERWRPRHGRATVRLSVVPSFAKLWLLPKLAAMLEHIPEVRVDVMVEHRTVDLDAGEADVVVRYGRGNWPGLHVRHLFSETLLPVASPDFVERLGNAPSLETLSGATLIHDSDTNQWRSWFAEKGIGYRPRIDDRKFEDYDLVLAAAEGSLGLALLRLPLAQMWLDSGRLVAVSSRSQPNRSAHFVAYRRGEARAGVLSFVDALCRMAEQSNVGTDT